MADFAGRVKSCLPAFCCVGSITDQAAAEPRHHHGNTVRRHPGSWDGTVWISPDFACRAEQPLKKWPAERMVESCVSTPALFDFAGRLPCTMPALGGKCQRAIPRFNRANSLTPDRRLRPSGNVARSKQASSSTAPSDPHWPRTTLYGSACACW